MNAGKEIMPLIYADTSALFAFFHPRDEFSDAVDAAVRETAPDFVYWPLLRFELRHHLRLANTDTDGAAAWQALRAGEKTATRLRWHELSADQLIETADELSAEKTPTCVSTDVLHAAAARRVMLLHELEQFWTCDNAQAEFARSVGLVTRLFKTDSR
jgi:predicted nucleic acid-binding protein